MTGRGPNVHQAPAEGPGALDPERGHEVHLSLLSPPEKRCAPGRGFMSVMQTIVVLPGALCIVRGTNKLCILCKRRRLVQACSRVNVGHRT